MQFTEVYSVTSRNKRLACARYSAPIATEVKLIYYCSSDKTFIETNQPSGGIDQITPRSDCCPPDYGATTPLAGPPHNTQVRLSPPVGAPPAKLERWPSTLVCRRTRASSLLVKSPSFRAGVRPPRGPDLCAPPRRRSRRGHSCYSKAKAVAFQASMAPSLRPAFWLGI